MTQEIETKIELTAAAFARLLAGSTVLSEVDQLNVYYDCRDAISHRSGSLRIRFVRGAAPVITLKLPIERSGGRRVSYELEEQFSRRLPPRVIRVRDLPHALQLQLQEICSVPPRRLGAMRTHRKTVRLPGGDVVEMDEVVLPGGRVFHEVEIESDDPVTHDAAVAAVQRSAPDCRMSERGKFQRFRDALRELDASDDGAMRR